MIAFPKAKINIGLNIVKKLDDGFHNIETAFLPIELCDILEFVASPNNKMEFTTSGLFIDGNDENNLVIKAYNLVAKDFQLPPLQIHLHKHIPMGAGLGGGSSDAASMLKMLNENFSLGLSVEDLIEYAKLLGSDVAFFIESKPTIGVGRGDILTQIDLTILKGLKIIVVKPDIHISTSEAYAGVSPEVPKKKLIDTFQLPIEKWQGVIKNDFENSLFPNYPVLKDIKQKFIDSGAIYSSMSGSGSAVFGIFLKDKEFDFENCFVWNGLL